MDVAVLEPARGGILLEGMGFDRCGVRLDGLSEGDRFDLRARRPSAVPREVAERALLAEGSRGEAVHP